MKKKAILLRGAPASGKSTLSHQLVKCFEEKAALIDLDTFRWHFHLTNRSIHDITPEEHAFAYQNLLTLLENYAKNGSYHLVVEGLFSWNESSQHGNVGQIVELFKAYSFEANLFLLSAPKKTLWERNVKREYTVPQEEFDTLYEEVMSSTNPEKEVVINQEGIEIQAALAIIKTHIF